MNTLFELDSSFLDNDIQMFDMNKYKQNVPLISNILKRYSPHGEADTDYNSDNSEPDFVTSLLADFMYISLHLATMSIIRIQVL